MSASLTVFELLGFMDSTMLIVCIKFCVFCYTIGCILLYILNYVIGFNRSAKKRFVGRKVLLITAHPDDECMFFSPVLVQLSLYSSIHVLCVTTGNYYKKGEIRKLEILKSCQILGISSQNVEVVDDSSFCDHPVAPWDLEKLGMLIDSVIARIQPNYILTFDEQGVSGHPNHIAVSKGVKHWLSCASPTTQNLPTLYQLESVSLIRKYISFLDLPASLASQNLIFVSSIPCIIRGQRAMCSHYSQLQWFRILYIIFSRYIIINTFIEITL